MRQVYARGTDRDIQVNTQEPLDAMRVDPVKLMIAMVHLIDNAVNYSPEDTLIEVEAASNGDALKVSVMDRGQCVPEAARPRIFNRFYGV